MFFFLLNKLLFFINDIVIFLVFFYFVVSYINGFKIVISVVLNIGDDLLISLNFFLIVFF